MIKNQALKLKMRQGWLPWQLLMALRLKISFLGLEQFFFCVNILLPSRIAEIRLPSSTVCNC
jgi:hypothetical protein